MSIDVFKPTGCKVYHYRFQVGGVRTQRTTRLRNKAEAEKVADRAYARALERANGGQVVPTLGELFAEWERTRAPVASAAHRKSVDVVRRLHLYDLADLRLTELTTDRMERARNQHLVEHKAASVNHWLRIVKLVVNWAVKRKIIARLPWEVDMLKVQKRPRAILPVEAAMEWFAEIDAVTARAPAVATAIRMMFGAGLREGEAAGARWEWLDWARGTYTPGVTKGREAEPIPLPEWLLAHLLPLRQDEGLIAPRADGTQMPPGFARTPMQQANSKCSTKGITPHRLRGSFATLLSENGATIQTIQAVMRHKSHITTMAYLEKDMTKVASAQSNIAGKIGFARQENGK